MKKVRIKKRYSTLLQEWRYDIQTRPSWWPFWFDYASFSDENKAIRVAEVARVLVRKSSIIWRSW